MYPLKVLFTLTLFIYHPPKIQIRECEKQIRGVHLELSYFLFFFVFLSYLELFSKYIGTTQMIDNVYILIYYN